MEEPTALPPITLEAGSRTVSELMTSIGLELKANHGISMEEQVLSEYIVVMLINGKPKMEVAEHLSAFLQDGAPRFVDWLWRHMYNKYVAPKSVTSQKDLASYSKSKAQESPPSPKRDLERRPSPSPSWSPHRAREREHRTNRRGSPAPSHRRAASRRSPSPSRSRSRSRSFSRSPPRRSARRSPHLRSPSRRTYRHSDRRSMERRHGSSPPRWRRESNRDRWSTSDGDEDAQFSRRTARKGRMYADDEGSEAVVVEGQYSEDDVSDNGGVSKEGVAQEVRSPQGQDSIAPPSVSSRLVGAALKGAIRGTRADSRPRKTINTRGPASSIEHRTVEGENRGQERLSSSTQDMAGLEEGRKTLVVVKRRGGKNSSSTIRQVYPVDSDPQPPMAGVEEKSSVGRSGDRDRAAEQGAAHAPMSHLPMHPHAPPMMGGTPFVPGMPPVHAFGGVPPIYNIPPAMLMSFMENFQQFVGSGAPPASGPRKRPASSGEFQPGRGGWGQGPEQKRPKIAEPEPSSDPLQTSLDDIIRKRDQKGGKGTSKLPSSAPTKDAQPPLHTTPEFMSFMMSQLGAGFPVTGGPPGYAMGRGRGRGGIGRGRGRGRGTTSTPHEEETTKLSVEDRLNRSLEEVPVSSEVDPAYSTTAVSAGNSWEFAGSSRGRGRGSVPARGRGVGRGRGRGRGRGLTSESTSETSSAESSSVASSPVKSMTWVNPNRQYASGSVPTNVWVNPALVKKSATGKAEDSE